MTQPNYPTDNDTEKINLPSDLLRRLRALGVTRGLKLYGLIAALSVFGVNSVANRALVVQDKTGRILVSNRIARQLLGLGRKKIIGKTTDDENWTAEDVDGKTLKTSEHPSVRSLKYGESIRDEEMLVHTVAGRNFWVSIDSEPIFDADGSVQAVAIAFSEIPAPSAVNVLETRQRRTA